MYPRSPVPLVKETAWGVSQGWNKCCAWEHDVDETYGKGGHVKKVPNTILHHLIDAIDVGYGERRPLSRRVQIPGIRDWGSSDVATRRRRVTAVPFLDDPESRG